jgi:hypothetical protein
MKSKRSDVNSPVTLSTLSQDESVDQLHGFSRLSRDGTVVWAIRQSTIDKFTAVDACLKTANDTLTDTSIRLALCHVGNKWVWRVDNDNKYPHKYPITREDYMNLQQEVRNNFFCFVKSNNLIVSTDPEVKKSLLGKQEIYKFRGENYLEHIETLRSKLHGLPSPSVPDMDKIEQPVTPPTPKTKLAK